MVTGMATPKTLVHTDAMRVTCVLFAMLVPALCQPLSITAPTDPARALALSLRRIGVEGRLLYITAHPDDEDNGLLAYYRHGRGMDVTLLTLTRGAGGQNEIGDELFEALAVLRSEELRAAHLFDGARQRFSRAFEFGYSFSVTETFQKWGEEEILRDVVRVMRETRPHVVVTMSIATEGGGRHHQAAAFAARRAFDLAASDTWPELGPPWAASRLFESASRGGEAPRYGVPLQEYDPVLGCTYAAFGFVARSLHKCQGTGQVRPLDPAARRRSRGGRLLSRRRGPPPPASGDLFAGLPIYRDPRTGALDARPADTWQGGQVPNAASPQQVAERLRSLLQECVPEARPAVMAALSQAVPLQVEAVAGKPTVIPGERVGVRVALHNRSHLPITVNGCFIEGRFRRGAGADLDEVWNGDLRPGERRVVPVTVEVPAKADRWTGVRLRRDPRADRYVGSSDRLHDPACARVVVLADAAGLPLEITPTPVRYRETDPVFPAMKELDLALLPRVQVGIHPPVLPVPVDDDGRRAPATFRVKVGQGAEDRCLVVVRMTEVDGDGSCEQRFVMYGPGERDVTFSEEDLGPVRAGRWQVSASVASGEGLAEAVSMQPVTYPHIRRVFLERPATAEAVVFPCSLPGGRAVGWVEGTGDQVDDCLELAGVPLRRLSDGDLLQGDLDRFDVIVTGVRAYKVREDLKAAHPRLLRWMKEGGHLVVLYNKSPDMNSGRSGRGGSPWAPYTARVSRDRVTVEEAPVVVRSPTHRLFNRPNPILASDWDGWVQERGLYFLETRDERFRELLSMTEPWPGNPGEKTGALVTAAVGDGSWTYVGLALFRQLPAGVPGAYRLMANLLAQERR